MADEWQIMADGKSSAIMYLAINQQINLILWQIAVKMTFLGQEHGEKHILPRGTYNDGSKNIQNRDISLLLLVISNYCSIFANS